MACSNSPTGNVWRFRLENGNTSEMSVSDPLLDTEARARERAKSEFLKNGYAKNVITFKTHRTNIKMNDAIKLGGIVYLVKGISASIDSTSIISTIKAVRYD